MNTITNASRVALFAALLPAAAWAGPREEVVASANKFMAARSYHVAMDHVGAAQRMRSQMEFVAPDRYRMTMEGVGQQILIGDTLYMTMQGRTMKLPMPKGTMTQWRQPARIAENLQNMRVTPLGTERVGTVTARKYRLDYTRPVSSMTYWIGPDGYPLQAVTVGDGGKGKVTTTIRYSRFNDPTIRVDVPK